METNNTNKPNRYLQAEECILEGLALAREANSPEAKASIRRTFYRLSQSYLLMAQLGV